MVQPIEDRSDMACSIVYGSFAEVLFHNHPSKASNRHCVKNMLQFYPNAFPNPKPSVFLFTMGYDHTSITILKRADTPQPLCGSGASALEMVNVHQEIPSKPGCEFVVRSQAQC